MKKFPWLTLITLWLLLCCTREGEARHQDAPKPAGGASFSFAQITDTHLKAPEEWARTKKVIEHLNALPFKIDFVVHTGDIFMDNMTPKVVARAKTLFARLKMPIYFLPGNHDIIKAAPEASRELFVKELGPLARAFRHKGVWISMLYTEPLAQRVGFADFAPLAALRKALSRRRSEPVLLFHHAPSTPDFFRNRYHNSWPARVKREWGKTLKRHGVTAVIAGHFHRDELQYIDHIPVFISPPAASYWGRQATYRTFKWQEGKLTYTSHYPR